MAMKGLGWYIDTNGIKKHNISNKCWVGIHALLVLEARKILQGYRIPKGFKQN